MIRLALGAVLVTASLATPVATAIAVPATEPPGEIQTAAIADTGWHVTPIGPQRLLVRWRATRPFPLQADTPRIVAVAGGVGSVGHTRLLDRRTVQAVVQRAAGQSTAVSADAFDVLLSGRAYDEPGWSRGLSARAREGVDYPHTPTPSRLAADPGAPGPMATTSSDYTMDPIRLPGLPAPVEMVGHVVEPYLPTAKPRPLVVLLHGRHDVCFDPADPRNYAETWPCGAPFEEIPSHLGYGYLQEHLASLGFVTVSIRANGINAQDFRLADGGAQARGALIAGHVRAWQARAQERGSTPGFDRKRVILIGHSRGGEGANRAAIEASADGSVRVAGQVLIAPTNFGSQSAPFVPTVTLLPYCDGDVVDLQGQRYTDVARDLSHHDPSLKSSVMLMGTNHNFFNTEWTPGQSAAPASDDWSGDARLGCGVLSKTRLDANGQQQAGLTYVAGAVRLMAGEHQFLPLFDGRLVTTESLGTTRAYSHALGGDRATRVPHDRIELTLPAGATSRFCTGVVGGRNQRAACGETALDAESPHWQPNYEPAHRRRFLEMRWTASGQRAGLRWLEPLDLRSRRLDLRILDSQQGSPSPVFDVRLTDRQGVSVQATAQRDGQLAALLPGPFLAKLWGQVLTLDTRVNPSRFAGLDLSQIVAVELVARTSSGRVWLADLSSTQETLPWVPPHRLPLVDVGSARVVEGNRGLSDVLRIPLTLTPGVAVPSQASRVIVRLDGQAPGDRDQYAVDFAPGQTQSVVEVPYEINRLDDIRRRITQVVAWPAVNAMTRTYLGTAVVVDDDPAPTARLLTPRTTVVEGQALRWVVRLSQPVNYEIFAPLHFERPAGAEIRGIDLGRRWLENHVQGAGWQRPLSQLQPYVFVALRQGQTEAEIIIPTVRDAQVEAPRRARIAFRLFGQRHVSVITLKDAAP